MVHEEKTKKHKSIVLRGWVKRCRRTKLNDFNLPLRMTPNESVHCKNFLSSYHTITYVAINVDPNKIRTYSLRTCSRTSTHVQTTEGTWSTRLIIRESPQLQDTNMYVSRHYPVFYSPTKFLRKLGDGQELLNLGPRSGFSTHYSHTGRKGRQHSYVGAPPNDATSIPLNCPLYIAKSERAKITP